MQMILPPTEDLLRNVETAVGEVCSSARGGKKVKIAQNCISTKLWRYFYKMVKTGDISTKAAFWFE